MGTSRVLQKHATLTPHHDNTFRFFEKFFKSYHHKGLKIILTKFEVYLINTQGRICQSTAPGKGEKFPKISHLIQNGQIPVGFRA